MDLGKRDEVCRLFNKFEVKLGVLLLVAFLQAPPGWSRLYPQKGS